MTLFARAFIRLLALLPAGGPAWLARRLAPLWMALSPAKRATAEANLAHCYPELDASSRQRLLLASFEHYICSVLETGRNWYWPVERLMSLGDPPVDEDLLRQATDAPAGLVLLAPHFGAWETLGLYLQGFGKVAILYKEPRHPSIARMLRERRGRAGARMVAANAAGLRHLFAHLRAGHTAGVLPDQEPSAGQGRFAPFFGIPALTGVLVSRLVRKTGSRVLFAVCERRPRGRFRVHVIEPGEAVYSDDTDAALAAINRAVERCVAVDPAQYLWSYKRFRTRPPGDPPFYP